MNMPPTTFTPRLELTYFATLPVLKQLNGTYEDRDKRHAWAARLVVTDEERAHLVGQAIRGGVVAELPQVAGGLSSPINRINAVAQRMMKRAPHGWNAQLNRPDLHKPGTIKPKQLHVTRESLAYPGTDKKVPTRVVTLFETQLGNDNTLSPPVKVGQVNGFELGESFLLFRKADNPEAGEVDALGAPSTPGPNEGRVLVINADGWEPQGENGEPETTALPDGPAIAYAVPSGYGAQPVRENLGSDIVRTAKELPCFATIKKADKENADEAIFVQTKGFRELMMAESIEDRSCAARNLIKAAAGTHRPGYMANTLLQKRDAVRRAPPQLVSDAPVPSILTTRGSDTYDQSAFAALNDQKVDILAVRNGKRTRMSELTAELQQLGILSQYECIYLSSSRSPEAPSPTQLSQWWHPFSDNASDCLPHEPEARRYMRTVEEDIVVVREYKIGPSAAGGS
jgi:hypothetical protein